MKKAKCPACKKTIELERGFQVDDLIKCPECKTILEVIRMEPLVLDWADDPITSSSAQRNRMY